VCSYSVFPTSDVHSLDQEEGTIEGHEQLKSYITSYYKGLLGTPKESDVFLDESRIDDIPKCLGKEMIFLPPIILKRR
jgi:hypothetical protein